MIARIAIISAMVGGLTKAATGDVAVLYDPDLVPGTTQTPDEQGFAKLSSDLLNQSGFYSIGDGVTEFDSGPGLGQIAVFGTHGLFTGAQQHPAAQLLDRFAGFRISFHLAIHFEQHDPLIDQNADGKIDNAGFSIGVISSDLKGIGIQFWEDRIWITEDDAAGELELLTQAESIEQPAEILSKLRRYDLEIKGDGYRLRADGKTLLSGRLRDYSGFEGIAAPPFGVVNSFDKPNSITFGDATRVSRSQVSIGEITSETPFEPEWEPSIEIEPADGGGFLLRWNAVPGTIYSIRDSEDLQLFREFTDHDATRFVEEFTDHRPLVPRRFYKIAPVPAP